VASAGITDGTFAALLEAHWDATMAARPMWATMLGDHRFDDKLGDPSIEAAAAARARNEAFLARAEAIDAATLSASDAMYLALFRRALEADIAESLCAFPSWSLSPRNNAVGELQGILEMHPLGDGADGKSLIARVDAWVASVDATLAALKTGLSEGRVANATSTTYVIEMARNVAGTETWEVFSRLEGDGWGTTRAQLEARLSGAVPEALERYANTLESDILPNARDDDAPGLASVPDGGACYEARIRRYTTLPLTADELHQRGLDELAKIHAEFVAPGAAVFGVWDRALLFERLRTDPELYFDTPEAIVAKAEGALARAEAAVPAVFGRLPEAPCVVTEIPAYEAPYTTIAYYRQPNPDGSKPGEYFVNTYAPTTRPRHEAEVLAFHESVPGHHLQIALSFELPDAPAFHKYDGTTVFVEGWALYTERLADELGLYSGDLDRLGMLSFDAWRAARLVVDTGLHAKGWSREQAVEFMLENTPLPENNIRNEVDRYITWPVQALAYKTGQLEILQLRREAETALGDRFDLSGFHDVVLGRGAVDMGLLREAVKRWVADQG
jgi:uncharacterized protein (DUF885 family)